MKPIYVLAILLVTTLFLGYKCVSYYTQIEEYEDVVNNMKLKIERLEEDKKELLVKANKDVIRSNNIRKKGDKIKYEAQSKNSVCDIIPVSNSYVDGLRNILSSK